MSDVLNNPIVGTPYDPRRQAWLRMTDAGFGQGLNGPAVETADELHTPSPTVGGDSPTTPVMAQGSEAGPFPRTAANSTPASLAPNPGAGPGLGPVASDDDGLDALYRRILEQSMDDTPSASRITDLETKMADLQRPKVSPWIETLVNVAPLIAGAAMGGQAGLSGAAAGTNARLQRERDYQLQERDRLGKEIESERGRQERQYERRLQLPVAIEGMRATREYRRGMLANAGAKNEIAADAAVQRKRANDIALLKAGYDPNTMEPIPAERLPLVEKAHMDLWASQDEVNHARAELTKAQNDPNSPAFQLAKARVDAALANAQAAISRADSMGLRAAVAEAIYMRGTFGTDINGVVLPGTFSDPNTGGTLGWQAPGNPVAATKYRGQTADSVLRHFDSNPATGEVGLIEMIQQTPDSELGLLKGHVNDWAIGKWGYDNPRLAALRQKLGLTSSAMMLSHVGQSGGVEMLNNFKAGLNMGQSKGNLLATLGETKYFMETYEHAGTPNAGAGTANPSATRVMGTPNTSAPAPGSSMLKKSTPGSTMLKKKGAGAGAEVEKVDYEYVPGKGLTAVGR